ncbi:DUF397 domain-containing protein [Kitasatospora sp. NPDC059088]|uniref:DUF397 domain-containing protein n=1 Tax=Kitasatospora sp. NPDC059088 TaxID=3346722 RepID=UPI0036CF1BE7
MSGEVGGRADWFTSSYGSNGGQCVEVSGSMPGLVPVRDSKDPQGPRLAFPADAWRSFLTAVRAGEFGEV